MSTTLFYPNQRSNHNDSLKPPFTPSRTEAKGVPNPTTDTFNKYIHKSLLQFNSASAVESAELPVSGDLIMVNASPTSRDAENSVKLFGFSLKDSANAAAAVDRFPSAVGTTDKPPLDLEGQRTHLKLERKDHSDCEDRELGELPIIGLPSSRHRIKVLKKGHTVGRSVDLSKFSGYPQLIHALEKLFHMEGELTDPSMGWQITYTDNEGDMMLVGDDPWHEFVDIAGKIRILTHEELQAVSSGTLATSAHSRSGEQHFNNVASTEYQDSSSPTAPCLRN